jgi:hypothetical protein
MGVKRETLESGKVLEVLIERFTKDNTEKTLFPVLGCLRDSFVWIPGTIIMSREDEEDLQGFRLIQASEGCHNYAAQWWPAGHVLGYENTFAHQFYEFYEAIANDKPTCPDFYDGYKCCQILDAVEASVANRCWIDVNEI